MSSRDPTLVAQTFDRLAPTFDDVIRRNPINAWMREVNVAKLRETFVAGNRLLELGCGNGRDAIELARHGCQVFGFDLSQGMVAEAQRRIEREGMQGRVVVAQGRIQNLLEVVQSSPWRPFDGAYANFCLTYEDDIRAVAQALARVLRPGSYFVCTLPNRMVLSELLIYGPQLRFREVLWRLRTPLLKDVDGSMLEIHAYTPRQVRQAFDEGFELLEIIGIPTFLPPVYLHPQYRLLGGGQRFLRWLDRNFSGRFPWNHLGEHTLFKFRRRGP